MRPLLSLNLSQVRVRTAIYPVTDTLALRSGLDSYYRLFFHPAGFPLTPSLARRAVCYPHIGTAIERPIKRPIRP